MKAIIVDRLKRLGLYESAKVPWDWYSRGARGLSAAKQRGKMRRFYSHFISKGDLCFDVGANVGNRTEIFLGLGASVVCIEPQHNCAQQLQQRFGQCPGIRIVEQAVGDSEGFAELAVCDEFPTLSTLSDGWKTEGRFAGECHWSKTVRVPVTTLDALIVTYGMPKFCKIDVEGFEAQVLQGLTRPIPFISFEFHRELLESATRSTKQLLSAGPCEFQVSLGESMEFFFPRWVPAAKLCETLESLPDGSWGDIYTRHI